MRTSERSELSEVSRFWSSCAWHSEHRDLCPCFQETMPQPQLYALDFDGVICDSCHELYQTAFSAAKQVWPGLTGPTPWPVMPEWLEQSTRRIRPVLETGWEGILMIHLLVEAFSSGGAQQVQVVEHQMLEAWPDMVSPALQRLGVTKEQLVQVFGGVRDEWMQTDLDGWLKSSGFYEGVASAVQSASEKGRACMRYHTWTRVACNAWYWAVELA